MDLSRHQRTQKGAVFATCPWCGWHEHQVPAIPPIGFTAVPIACGRNKCHRSYIVLVEVRQVELAYRLRVIGERKLFGHDPANLHRALSSFHVLNDEELLAAETILGLWLTQAQLKVPA